VTFVALGLLFMMLAVALIKRRVPPNGFYGLRVPATFQDRKVWYEANARSGRDLLALGIMLVLLALGLPMFSVGQGTYEGIWAAAAVGGVTFVAGLGWRRANRLLEERRADRLRPNDGLQATDPRA
jgi:hypothetical protein